MGSILAGTFINPYQSKNFDSPDNYNLDYENVTFKTDDDVEISAWLIKGDEKKVIIHNHFGVQCCKSGYNQSNRWFWDKNFHKDIKFLREAKYLNEAGFTVLLYDMRMHGDSGMSKKYPYVSWSKHEALDNKAAVDFILNRYKEAKIGLLSVCMGKFFFFNF